MRGLIASYNAIINFILFNLEKILGISFSMIHHFFINQVIKHFANQNRNEAYFAGGFEPKQLLDHYERKSQYRKRFFR